MTIDRNHIFLCLAGWTLILAACASGPTQVAATLTPAPSAEFRAYRTATPSRTPEPVIDLTPLSITPAPSATPFTHKVAKGETMLGIALKYGIKLEDLLAANPTVNPRILSIDTLLVIPLENASGEPTPTLTPLPLNISAPRCYPAVGQGLYCLVEIQNTLDQAVENLSVWVGLFSGEQTQASQVVVPALNILRSGKSIPVVAYFSGPLPSGLRPRAELLTVLPVAEEDQRYLPAQLDVLQVEISPDGLQVQVSGRVSWSPEQPAPGSLWVAVMAYDAAGNPVGLRKLETRPACTQTPGGEACTSVDVKVTVYSLGPAIRRVEGLVEARP